MRLAQLLTVALCLASAPAALAKGPSQFRGLKATVESRNLRPKAHTFAAQCASFAGNWTGTCVDSDGQSDAETLTIEQDDCESISVGGIFTDIFGSTTMTLAPALGSEWGAATLIQSYAWNDSQTRLNGLSNISFMNGSYATISGNAMWLDGESLHVKDTFSTPVMGSTGPSGWTFVTTDCTYTKVP